jgi:molybdate transport system ATP-binding protein
MTLSVALKHTNGIHLEIDFECKSGELLALVGPSGSGKTSTLRAIAGLMPIEQGKIYLRDQEKNHIWLDTQNHIHIPSFERQVGMVFQNYALFPHLTALQNIALALPKGDSIEIAQQLMEDMGLIDFHDRLPDQLSGGQRQRVALARAFARKPQVLLLDEPFSAVDHPTRKTLYEELIKLRENISIPIVIVTHDLREARLLSDRLCILDQGKSLQIGHPEHIVSSPRNGRVAELVGLTDIFSATFLKAQHPDQVLQKQATLLWGQGVEAFPLTIFDKGRLPDQTEVKWVIAKEFVEISKNPFERINTLSAKVHQVRRLGEISSVDFEVELAFGPMMHFELSTRLVNELNIDVDDQVFLYLDPKGIHIMPVYSSPAHKEVEKKKRDKPLKIVAVILVAGEGSRLGGLPKSLIKIDGQTILERQLNALQELEIEDIVLVTGFYQEAYKELNLPSNVLHAHNEQASTGQGSSVRLALKTVYEKLEEVDAIIMLLGDLPQVNAADLRQLIEQFKIRSKGEVVMPLVSSQRGNPVIISEKVLKEIVSSENLTVRGWMDQYPNEVEVWQTENQHFTFDFDTKENIETFVKKTGSKVELPSKP